MNKKLLSLYGLKWNPFSPDLPTEALRSVPQVQRLACGCREERGFPGLCRANDPQMHGLHLQLRCGEGQARALPLRHLSVRIQRSRYGQI